jgi:hypothetical protein
MSRSTASSAARSLLVLVALAAAPAAAEPVDRAAIEREVLSGGEAMRVLRDEFPSSFAALLDRLIAAGDPSRAWRIGWEWGREFARSNAVLMRSAPAEHVLAYLEAQRRRIATVRDEIGDARCSRWNTGVDPALERVLGERFLPLTEAITVAAIRAFAAALDRPTPRERPTNADWAALRETFSRHGLGELMIATLQAQDPGDSSGCEATLRMLDSVLALDGHAGDVIRASIAEDLVRADAGG